MTHAKTNPHIEYLADRLVEIASAHATASKAQNCLEELIDIGYDAGIDMEVMHREASTPSNLAWHMAFRHSDQVCSLLARHK